MIWYEEQVAQLTCAAPQDMEAQFEIQGILPETPGENLWLGAFHHLRMGVSTFRLLVSRLFILFHRFDLARSPFLREERFERSHIC